VAPRGPRAQAETVAPVVSAPGRAGWTPSPAYLKGQGGGMCWRRTGTARALFTDWSAPRARRPQPGLVDVHRAGGAQGLRALGEGGVRHARPPSAPPPPAGRTTPIFTELIERLHQAQPGGAQLVAALRRCGRSAAGTKHLHHPALGRRGPSQHTRAAGRPTTRSRCSSTFTHRRGPGGQARRPGRRDRLGRQQRSRRPGVRQAEFPAPAPGRRGDSRPGSQAGGPPKLVVLGDRMGFEDQLDGHAPTLGPRADTRPVRGS